MSGHDAGWLGDRSNLEQYPMGPMVCSMLQRDNGWDESVAWRMIEFWHAAMPDLTVEQILRLIVVVQLRDKAIAQGEDIVG
jgi:hypothetical protein